VRRDPRARSVRRVPRSGLEPRGAPREGSRLRPGRKAQRGAGRAARRAQVGSERFAHVPEPRANLRGTRRPPARTLLLLRGLAARSRRPGQQARGRATDPRRLSRRSHASRTGGDQSGSPELERVDPDLGGRTRQCPGEGGSGGGAPGDRGRTRRPECVSPARSGAPGTLPSGAPAVREPRRGTRAAPRHPRGGTRGIRPRGRALRANARWCGQPARARQGSCDVPRNGRSGRGPGSNSPNVRRGTSRRRGSRYSTG
jgi:hypothetical protein